jgi:hypothetical protein
MLRTTWSRTLTKDIIVMEGNNVVNVYNDLNKKSRIKLCDKLVKQGYVRVSQDSNSYTYNK